MRLAGKYEISAVGFDNQGETFVVWDKDTGEPVTPAIVWQDTRGQSVCEELAPTVDRESLRQKTGLLLDSYFSAPKLKWVFENYPEIRKKAHEGKLKFGTTETWVIWTLTKGKLHITDPSTASRTLLFDVNKFEWDEDLLKLFDVPRRMLPEVKPSAGILATWILEMASLCPCTLSCGPASRILWSGLFQGGGDEMFFWHGSFF